MALPKIKKIKEKCIKCDTNFSKMPFNRFNICPKCYEESKNESEHIWAEIMHDEIVYHD